MPPVPELFVAYIPAANVSKIPEPSLVVSIKGRYNDRPNINRTTHHVFELDFDVGSWAIEANYNLQEEQIANLMAFLKEHEGSGRNLYVHCTEGRIRSYTVADVLQRYTDFKMARRTECPLLGPGGAGDANTRDTLFDYFFKLEEAEEAAAAAAADPV